MRRLVSLLLLVGFLASSTLVAQAGYPDPGPARTNIFVQNLGTADAAMNLIFTNGDPGGQAWQTDTTGKIAPKASRYVLYSQLGGSIANGWTGAIEGSATQPMAALTNMFWDGPGATRAAATYTAVTNPTTAVYLPLLALRDDAQITRIVIQNTEDAAANITIYYYDRNGSSGGTRYFTIPPNSERTVDLATDPPNFWATDGLGSAYITSTNNKKIAAVATTHWFYASEAYSGVSSGHPTLWVPSVFRKYFPNGLWNYNATVIQNLGSVAANVHVEFYRQSDGLKTHEFDDTIQSKASNGYNTLYQGTMDYNKWLQMVTALGDSWQGTMKIICTNGQPLAGISFLYAYGTGFFDVISFNAIRDSEATSKALACPAVYRKRGNPGLPCDQAGAPSDQWSTTLVQNLNATPGSLTVEFYNTSGAFITSAVVSILGNGTARLNLCSGLELSQDVLNQLGTSFSGSMYVTPSQGIRIIGVTNIFWPLDKRASGYDAFFVP